MKQTILNLFIAGIMTCIMIIPALPIQAQMTLDGSGSVGVNAVNPVHIGDISDDEDADAALSGATSIYVSGKYAYVASNEGVEIIDISDPSNPTHIGSIFDDETTALQGATSIYVSGKYAYVTANIDGGVEIIDISDPSNPSHVGSILKSNNPSAELSGPHSIYVSGKYAYIASLNDSGVEIIDISDPAAPSHVGNISDLSISDRALGGAKSIYVSGKYAYVAAYTDDGVEILDISDPSHPIHKGAIFAGDSGALLDGASSIYVSGKYAYVAAYTDDAVEILDISDPESPEHVGEISANNSDALLDGARSIYVSGRYAYVAASFGVEVLDVSDPKHPTHVGSISNISGKSIYISGKYAFIASITGSDGVEILDISGIDVPAASIGSIAASTLEVSENAQVGNNLQVNGGLNVGPNGIKSEGPVSITRNGDDEDSNAILKLCRTNTDPASILGQEMLFYGHSIETQGAMYINKDSSNDIYLATGTDSGGDGSVGIGTDLNPTFARLFVNGNTFVNGAIYATGDITANDYQTISDARLKGNIRPIESALDKVNRLQGVYFNWLDPEKYDDRRHIGVIAQETAEVFPEVVLTHDDEAQTLSVNYSALVAPLIEAVKELSATVETLRDENAELRIRVENLEAGL